MESEGLIHLYAFLFYSLHFCSCLFDIELLMDPEIMKHYWWNT